MYERGGRERGRVEKYKDEFFHAVLQIGQGILKRLDAPKPS